MKRPTVRDLLSRIEELEAEVARLKAIKPMTAEDWIRVLRETQTPAVLPIPPIAPVAPWPPVQPVSPFDPFPYPFDPLNPLRITCAAEMH